MGAPCVEFFGVRAYPFHKTSKNIRCVIERAVARVRHDGEFRVHTASEIHPRFRTGERIAITQNNVARNTAAALRVERVGESAASVLHLLYLAISRAGFYRHFIQVLAFAFKCKIRAAQQGFLRTAVRIDFGISREGPLIDKA